MLLDGAQRAPHGPLDVQALGCDAYAFSGHKMFGPTGAGALWVRRELLAELPPFLGGGEMIRRVELREHHLRAAAASLRGRHAADRRRRSAWARRRGWLAALDWQAGARHELRLTERILDGLGHLPGVRILGPDGPPGPDRRGLVRRSTASMPTMSARCSTPGGVCLRGGHHCAQPLMERFDLAATARASLAPYNDDADVDALLEGLDEALALLR